MTNLYYVPASASQPATKKSQVSEFLRGTTGRGSDLALAEISDNGSVSSAQSISAGSSTNAYVYAASESKLVSIMLGKKDEPIKSVSYCSFLVLSFGDFVFTCGSSISIL